VRHCKPLKRNENVLQQAATTDSDHGDFKSLISLAVPRGLNLGYAGQAAAYALARRLGSDKCAVEVLSRRSEKAEGLGYCFVLVASPGPWCQPRVGALGRTHPAL
jgi:hypothetical protein